MIRIKGSGAIYGDVWFEEELPANANVDIVRYQCRPTPIAGARSTPFLSMVSDLDSEASALADAFGKDCRYKIRRADSKDGLTRDWVLNPQTRLQEFSEFFDAFAKQKSQECCDQQWLQAACQAGQLVLTAASRGGEALVWHAYLVSGRSAWLQYSASCFRDKDNDYRALVGRANRWLHWRDMLDFKESGMTRYDWGGLFEDESIPERAGINTFKKSFGGRIERTYKSIVPITIRGRLYLPLRDAWNSRKALLQARKASAATA